MASKYVTQAEAPNRSETNKYLNASGHWTVPAGGGGGGGTASDIEYDNTDSGLSADNVQDAIDEIAQGGGGGSDEKAMISDAWSSSIAYTVGEYAIDGNKLYKCIVANTNMRPSTNPTYWKETNVGDEISTVEDWSTRAINSASVSFQYLQCYKYGKIVHLSFMSAEMQLGTSSVNLWNNTFPQELRPAEGYPRFPVICYDNPSYNAFGFQNSAGLFNVTAQSSVRTRVQCFITYITKN